MVGAGPAGAAAARAIAQHGFRVLLLEEHARIGLPVHCSGLVTPRTLQLAGVGECFTLNTIRGAFVHAPSGKRLRLGGDRVHAYAVDRVGFDQALAQDAQAAGAELALRTKLLAWEHSAGRIRVRIASAGGERALTTRLLIGADGAQSRVAKGMNVRVVHDEQVVGLGAEVRLTVEDEGFVHVFVGSRVAPGFFAWLIPLGGGRARLGIATRMGHPAVHYLDVLRARFPQLFHGCEVLRLTGGIIPLRKLERISGDNVLLVGDAAGHTKPTSGGGIYTALLGALYCSRVAVAALRSDALHAVSLARYDAAWQADMGTELDHGRVLRRALLRLSDNELDGLITLLGTSGLDRLIARYGDIDFPSRLTAALTHWVQRLASLARFGAQPWLLSPHHPLGQSGSGEDKRVSVAVRGWSHE